MCMTLAAAGPGGAIAAADLRTNRYFSDGSAERSDHGGCLSELPGGGAVAGTGDALMVQAALRALSELKSASVPAMRRTLANTYNREADGIRRRLPDAEPEKSALLVVLPRGDGWQNRVFGPDGSELIEDPPTPIVSWPPELDKATRRRLRMQFESTVDGLPPHEWEPHVRSLFRATAALTDSMSAECEVWRSDREGILQPLRMETAS